MKPLRWMFDRCPHDTAQYLLTSLLLLSGYVISGKLALLLAQPPGFATAIFPPAGLAVAAALLGGKRFLPVIFISSLLLNLWTGYESQQQLDATGLMAALIIAAASVLQAAAGGSALRRLIGYPAPLDSSSHVLRFLLSAPFICLISASLSVGGLVALGIFPPPNK